VKVETCEGEKDELYIIKEWRAKCTNVRELKIVIVKIVGAWIVLKGNKCIESDIK
jgi:hypothetical protein